MRSNRRVVVFVANFIRTPFGIALSSLFGSVGARDVDVGCLAIGASPRHRHPPRVAADLAVLDETASRIRLDVDLDLLAAVRAYDKEEIVHGTRIVDLYEP